MYKMENDHQLFNLLKSSFTTDDEQRFVKHFGLYAGYGENSEDFVIDLDEVWEWMGFSKKSNAKRFLVKEFSEMIDYEVITGGQNKERVMLNIDTFKNMCMLSNSKKGKEIRTYYIKMEKVFFKYLKQKHENIVDTLKLESDKRIAVERHQYLAEAYKDKQCVFIMGLGSQWALMKVDRQKPVVPCKRRPTTS
jgi:phage anti-repressor protein